MYFSDIFILLPINGFDKPRLMVFPRCLLAGISWHLGRRVVRLVIMMLLYCVGALGAQRGYYGVVAQPFYAKNTINSLWK